MQPQRRARTRQIESRPQMTIIVRTLIRALLPVVLLFGVYIVTYGHLTPGGGFQGGMILVGAFMSLYLAFGYGTLRRFDEDALDLGEHIGALAYLLIGLVALIGGGAFLNNVLRGGGAGTLLSGGIILALNFVVGFKVTMGTLLVLLILLKALQKGNF